MATLLARVERDTGAVEDVAPTMQTRCRTARPVLPAGCGFVSTRSLRAVDTA